MDKIIKFLIIDDEEIVLRSTKKILKKDKNENYEIDTARNGDEGLKKADEKKYDIVITDLKMPGIGGMEVLKILREKQPDVMVIVFTGYATVETAREALKTGAFDYIPKPFTPDEFRNVINNAIKSRQDGSDAKMLDLMAIVSHELKSPTSVIYTSADTLYNGYFGNLEPQQQKILESIIRNCHYLEDIIRNYLDLSKMEMDGLGTINQEINLVDDVIQPVVDIPEHKDNLKKMPVVATFNVSPVINGDPNLLKIVITNLLNNAIKYGREGTAIKIDLADEGNSYKLSVFNEGVGVSREDMAKLFNKFSRLKQKGTEGVKGTGLGLYMCKKVLEKHNGEIWAESEQGKWISFNIRLPK